MKRELREAPPAPSREPEFFVPGVASGDARALETEYERLRAIASAADTESRLRGRRIFRIELRLGGTDHVIEVGRPYPTGGGEVLAIFDIGGAEPYVVCTDGDGGTTARLGRHVYTVGEFA